MVNKFPCGHAHHYTPLFSSCYFHLDHPPPGSWPSLTSLAHPSFCLEFHVADTSLFFKLCLQCHLLREAINDQRWQSWAPPHHPLHYILSYGICFFLHTIYKLWNFLFICLLLIFPSVKPILCTVVSLRPRTVVPAVDRINVGSVEIKRRTLTPVSASSIS